MTTYRAGETFLKSMTDGGKGKFLGGGAEVAKFLHLTGPPDSIFLLGILLEGGQLPGLGRRSRAEGSLIIPGWASSVSQSVHT